MPDLRYAPAAAPTLLAGALACLALLALLATPLKAQVTEGDDAPLRFGRFAHDGETVFGYLSSGGIHTLSGDFFQPGTEVTGDVIALEDLKVLVPSQPAAAVIAISDTYASSAGPELGVSLAPALLAQDGALALPADGAPLALEAGLAVVMALPTGPDQADGDVLSRIAGITIATRAAGAPDRLVSLGPWFVPGLTADRIGYEVHVNGKRVVRTSTSRLKTPVAGIVARAAALQPLAPGDVVFTGASGTTGPLKAGDVIEISMEGVGTLRHTVITDAD